MLSIREFKLNGKILTDWVHPFQKMELYKSMDTSVSIGIFTFVDLSVDLFLAETMKYGDKFEFRWGLDDKKCSHWHSYVIINSDIVKSGEGAMLTITVCDNSFHLKCNSAFSSYPNVSKSDLVTSIINSYKPMLPDAVVKKSNDSFTYLQTGENDWDFLLRNLNNSISNDDYGDYRLFWKDGNELHFHPPDYTQAPYRNISISNSSSCMRYKLRISMFKRSLYGGELSKVTGCLRDEIEFHTSDQKRTDYESKNSLSNRDIEDLSKKANRFGAFHGKYQFSETNTEQFIDNVAKNQLSKAYSRTYELEINIEGDPLMEPGSLIQVVDAKDQYIDEGLWLVEEVFHVVNKGQSHLTTAKLSRPFLPKGNQVMNVNANPKRTEAVGPLSVVEGKDVSNVMSGGVLKSPTQL